MLILNRFSTTLIAFASLALLSGSPFQASGAQTTAKQSLETPVTPRKTTETRIGDWTVSCSIGNDGTKTCSLFQRLAIKKTKQLLLGTLFTVDREKNLNITLRTPTNVLLPKGVTVRPSNGEPVTIAYRSCTPQQCIATSVLTKAFLEQLAGSEIVVVEFANANERNVKLQVPFKNFSKALEAFRAESKS